MNTLVVCNVHQLTSKPLPRSTRLGLQAKVAIFVALLNTAGIKLSVNVPMIGQETGRPVIIFEPHNHNTSARDNSANKVRN